MALSPSNAIQRPDLGLALEELDLTAQRKGFIGTRVFPVLDVALKTANFSRVSIRDLLKKRDTTRAPGGGYNRQYSNFEQDNYSCREHGVEEPVDDSEKQMYAYTIDSERIAMNRAVHSVLMDLEMRIAAKVFTTATWVDYTGNNASWHQIPVGDKWNDKTGCDPTNDVNAAWLYVWEACGLEPNCIIFNKEVMKNVKQASSIVDRIKYSGRDDPKNVTEQMLGELWDVPNVLVAGGQYNSANEGQAAGLSRIWTNAYAWVGRVAETNDVREPCAGRTFNWTADGSSPNGTVEMYRDETVRSDIIRVRQDTDEKALHAIAGVLLTGVTA